MYQQLCAWVLVRVGKMGPGLSMCSTGVPCATCQFVGCWVFLPQLTKGPSTLSTLLLGGCSPVLCRAVLRDGKIPLLMESGMSPQSWGVCLHPDVWLVLLLQPGHCMQSTQQCPGKEALVQLGSAPLLLRLLSITECQEGGGTRPGLGIMENRDPTASLGSCGTLPHTQGEKHFLISRWNFP